MHKQAVLVSLLKNMKENFRNLLTNCHFCGIIIMSRGVLKYRKQETVDRQKRNLSRIVRTNSLGLDSETNLLSTSNLCIRKIVANIF